MATILVYSKSGIQYGTQDSHRDNIGITSMTEVASKTTEQLLHFFCQPGIGSATLQNIVEHAEQHGVDSLIDEQEILSLFPPRSVRNGKKKGSQFSTVLKACEKDSVRIVSPLDDEYPSLLREIKDYPPLLYVRGKIAALSKTGCAVVGTREASRLGISWAKQISEIFTNNDFCVVSGLALGIDAAAHRGALDNGGTTIAVMAHGLDTITPGSNKELAQEILENGGALIAEHPPGTPPRRPEYVLRNRIQSGLSVCSIIVESGESGGAMHEARFTNDQDRKLYCIVPDENVDGFSEFNLGGARKLMSELAALPIHNSKDLRTIIRRELTAIPATKHATSNFERKKDVKATIPSEKQGVLFSQ